MPEGNNFDGRQPFRHRRHTFAKQSHHQGLQQEGFTSRCKIPRFRGHLGGWRPWPSFLPSNIGHKNSNPAISNSKVNPTAWWRWLATTQSMSSSKPSLNFIGADISIIAEEIGVEGFRTSRIPGMANSVAGYLSRSDKMANEELPSELVGIRVCKDDTPRGSEFYFLSPPQLSPDLWVSSAAANDIWARLR